MRRAGGARESRSIRRAANCRSSSPCCRPTRCRRSPIRSCCSPAAPARRRRRLDRSRCSSSAIRRTRDIVLIDQRGTGRSSPLDCAAFAPDEHAEFDIDPVPKSLLCAWQLAERKVDASQYTTTRVGRRSRGRPRSARLSPAEPVGRQLRHARRAGIPAALSGARAQRRARRRRAAVDAHLVRRLAHARRRARRRDRRVPRLGAVREGASRPGARRLREIGRTLEGGKTVTLRDPRTGITREMHVEFDMVDRRAAAAHLCAGSGEPDSGTARPCASRRLRAAASRRRSSSSATCPISSVRRCTTR